MANISAKEVQALRERTGVGMMKCKEALAFQMKPLKFELSLNM